MHIPKKSSTFAVQNKNNRKMMHLIQDLRNGKEYKTTHGLIENDKVLMLCDVFVRKGLITEKEWAHSQQLIVDKFPNTFKTMGVIDGRTKKAKSLPYFTWRLLFENN